MVKIESGRFRYSTPNKDPSSWNLGELTMMDAKITDSMLIHVVRKVQVEPKYKSLYVGSQSPFKFTILEGSGNFMVSVSDSNIAEVMHTDREVWVTPKKPGTVDLIIEDVDLPTTEASIAQILVSDIEKLNLWSTRSLIEQGDKIELIVSAFDSEGRDFDADQYADMQFNIETEMTGLVRKLGLKTQLTATNTHFHAEGREPGIYQLVTYA
jgi:hypothetical protein